MPESRPTAVDLLAGVIAYLEQELLPTLEGRHRFHVRVAANALAIVKRQLELGSGFDAAEAERLRALLSADGDLDALNRDLAQKIRDSEIAVDERMVEHLLRSVEDALAINNPRWTRD
jgi:hypothetical protein